MPCHVVVLAALVGKIFLHGGFCVCFARIHSMFALILLTYKIMIMFCIGVGYIGRCVDGSFYFFIIQKMENEFREIWLNPVSCKQSQCRGETKFHKLSKCHIRHLISLGFYYNTYQNIFDHRKCNNRL